MCCECILFVAGACSDFLPTNLLPSIVYLSNLTEVISQILVRADCGTGKIIGKYRQSLQNQWRSKREPLCEKSSLDSGKNDSISRSSTSSLQPFWYIGDGTLLSPIEVLIHCTNYCKDLLKLSSGFGYGFELESLNGVYDFYTDLNAGFLRINQWFFY